MLVRHYSEVREEKPMVPGAEATLRWLISKRDGAKNFAMRLFEIKRKGEKIPFHQHDFEHEIFVVSGFGKLKGRDKEFDLREGDAIFIQAGEEHSFENTREEPFKFICIIPILK
ncbi:MAG: cupin domain-containing protein [candidate division WOR-3 bacterium]